MKNLLRLVVGVFAAVLVGSATSDGAAAAPDSSLSCGQTITTNTVLGHDLVNCDGPGLVIGADGITLDLGGHTVSGRLHTETFQCERTGDFFTCHLCDAPGSPACGPPFATPEGFLDYETFPPRFPAVDDGGGFDRVTVGNGTIKEFLYGVRFVDAEGLVAHNLTDQNNSFENCFVCLENSDDGIVRDIGEAACCTTLDEDSDRNLLENVKGQFSVDGSHNTVRRSSGFIFVGGHENTIEQNHMGGRITVGGRGNIVRDNIMESAEAIWLQGATNTLVERNTVTGGGVTTYAIIVLDSDRNTIRGNLLRGPHLSAVAQTSSKGGISLCRASGNTIEDNVITAGFVGITLGIDSSCEETGLHGNVVRGNTISDGKGDGLLPESTGDGILVGPLATGTLVEQNRALRNSDDGIDVQNRTTILRRNIAIGNGDLGIEALRGAIDAGGNVAHGNGNPSQCVGVRCS
jgi:parallel beta-helix repeat protein